MLSGSETGRGARTRPLCGVRVYHACDRSGLGWGGRGRALKWGWGFAEHGLALGQADGLRKLF